MFSDKPPPRETLDCVGLVEKGRGRPHVKVHAQSLECNQNPPGIGEELRRTDPKVVHDFHLEVAQGNPEPKFEGLLIEVNLIRELEVTLS